ncbi:MAG: zinc-ribbon domain-containing protein [Candidatus Aenigmarchaeota archaeon]|nr:zinc-ribbon domain-containing protein [Candidatus Aenigmarchaeota archaeon]
MDLEYFLRSAWLFIIGVAISLVGVYTLVAMSQSVGSGSFVIMLVGLFFTGTGSIYGKRKMRGEYYMATEERDIVKKQKPKPTPFREPERAEGTEEFLEEAEQAEEQRVERPEISKPAFETTQKPTVEEHVKVIKVLVCPKCGAENQEMDKFCYNCGKKLRLKGFPEKGKQTKK